MAGKEKADVLQVALLLVLAFIGYQLYTGNGLNINIGGLGGGTTNIFPPDQVTETNGYSLSLAVSPNPVCQGANLSIAVNSNMPNAECAAFAKPAAGDWQFVTGFTLNGYGMYGTTTVVNLPTGAYDGALVCRDSNQNYKVSNILTLIVIDCGDGSDGSDEGGDNGVPPTVACGWHNQTIYSIGQCGGTCPTGQSCYAFGSTCNCVTPYIN